jgi:cbb3-type cytochrome oxidase subunit 3
MLRIALIPIVLLVLLVLSIILIWIIFRKVKKGVNYTVKKGAEIASDQQQKWTEKEQRKKLPVILQKGFSDYDKIDKLSSALPEEWSQPVLPLVNQSKDILDEIAIEFDGADDSKNATLQNKKLNSIRPFFIHSLDALLQFIEKLVSDHQKMTAAETDKARQNITVFKADLLNHQETLHKVRRFDFDVVMDVIKARLK